VITLVISLANAEDRRRELVPRMEAAGLDYRFIDAVLGKALSAHEVRRAAPNLFMPRYARDLTPGEIGCSLSHKLALETFLRSGEETALILEDDAAVPPNIRAVISEIAHGLPSDWGLLKLGGTGSVRGRFHSKTSCGSVINTATATLDSHAYVVSRIGAERLLRRLLPIVFPYDVFLRDVHTHGATTFELVPSFISTPDAKGSQIAGERQTSPRRSTLLNGPALMFWRLRHELRRRVYVFRRFGMKAAASPSRMTSFR
jgi:glycosyl transferase, family 25